MVVPSLRNVVSERVHGRKDHAYAPGMSAEMTYGHLGRSGLLVSRIGLGTMNFGFTIDESTSFAVMDTATDAASTSSTPPTSMAACSRRI